MILLAEASAAFEPYLARREQFGQDVLALLDQGRLLAATDYIHAQRLRRKMRREFGRIWAEVDCFVAPATPNTAPPIGAKTIHIAGQEEDVRLATTRFARAINALGCPAISVPCGLAAGLPAGLQIVAAPLAESVVLRIGAALEDAGVSIPPLHL